MKTALEHNKAYLYTKEMFRKFQDQVVEVSEYFVEKDKDNVTLRCKVTHHKCFRHLTNVNKRTTYDVKFNKAALTSTCVCRIFEHLGILCQ